MTLAATETLIRVRQATRDRYGDPVGDPAELAVEGCVTWPADGNGTAGNELTDRADTVIVGLTALLPTGTDVRATDQWLRAGLPYETVGEPAVWQSPLSGSSAGVTVLLRRVTG
jgi:hypothetical protein